MWEGASDKPAAAVQQIPAKLVGGVQEGDHSTGEAQEPDILRCSRREEADVWVCYLPLVLGVLCQVSLNHSMTMSPGVPKCRGSHHRSHLSGGGLSAEQVPHTSYYIEEVNPKTNINTSQIP